MSPRQVVVHDIDQAKAALAAAGELGAPIQLRSAPHASAYAGLEYLRALGEAAGHELLIDCHDDAGLVMAALHIGCRKLAFCGPPEIAAKLADMAEQAGADFHIETGPPEALHLAPEDDAAAACRAWLAAQADRA